MSRVLARIYAQADYFLSSPFPYNDSLISVGLVFVRGWTFTIGCYPVASQEPLEVHPTLEVGVVCGS